MKRFLPLLGIILALSTTTPAYAHTAKKSQKSRARTSKKNPVQEVGLGYPCNGTAAAGDLIVRGHTVVGLTASLGCTDPDEHWMLIDWNSPTKGNVPSSSDTVFEVYVETGASFSWDTRQLHAYGIKSTHGPLAFNNTNPAPSADSYPSGAPDACEPARLAKSTLEVVVPTAGAPYRTPLCP